MTAKPHTFRLTGQIAATVLVALSVLGAAVHHSYAQDSAVVVPTATTLNRWQRTTPLPVNISDIPAVATSTHVYILGGSDTHDLRPNVFVAPIHADGSLGDWDATEPLIGSRGGSRAALVGSTVIVTGVTRNGVAAADSVEYAAIGTDGTLSPWKLGPPLITNRSAHAMVAAGRFVYVIAGYNETKDANKPLPVEYATVQEDGTLGPWSETTPNLTARSQLSAAYHDGFLYIVGGQAPTGMWTIDDEVIERARVNSDGTLGAWMALSPRMTATNGLGALIHEGNLVYFGGYTEGATQVDTVQRATIDPLGDLGAWTPAQSLTARRSWFASTLSGSRVYVMGGAGAGGMPVRSVEWIDLSQGLPQLIEDSRLTVNNGALFTNQISVTLSLQALSAVGEMMLSNDGGFYGADWEPFAESKPWAITQYGVSVIPRVVYAKFRTFDGVISSVMQDDIILDVTAPEGSVQVEPANVLAIQSVEAAGSSSAAFSSTVFLPAVVCTLCQPSGLANTSLKLTAQDDASGVGQMLVSNSPNFAAAAWEPFKRSKAWSVPAGRTTRVYVKYKDNAGNVSEAFSDTVTIP